MTAPIRAASAALLLVLVAAPLLLALLLLVAAQAIVAGAATALDERVSRRGNQIFRLGQRLRAADERLVAALDIVMERPQC